jgi:DNA-binding transcriptional ArsR family regulator
MMKFEPTSKIFPIPGSSFADSGTVKTMAGDERETYLWLSLVPRLIHPVKLVILETFLYMEQELSASQIAALLNSSNYSPGVISYHLKVLAEAGVIELVESKKIRGSEMHLYNLPEPVRA